MMDGSKRANEGTPLGGRVPGDGELFLDSVEAARGRDAAHFASLAGQPFTTKDSGVRAEFASGMVRDTEAGKARFDLLFPLGIPYGQQILTRFAELMERGAVKYEERNWEKADGKVEYDRMKRSALRHMIQWFVGETDEDHAAAVMFNIMAAETTKVKMQQPDLGCSTLPDGSCVASDCRLHASPLPEDACPCYAPGDMDCFASDCQSGGPRPCPNCMPGLCKTCDGAASR